jgi:hypothetical protein
MKERCDESERVSLSKNIFCKAGMLCGAKNYLCPVTLGYDEYGELSVLLPSSKIIAITR